MYAQITKSSTFQAATALAAALVCQIRPRSIMYSTGPSLILTDDLPVTLALGVQTVAHVKVVTGLLILNSDLQTREGRGINGDDWMDLHAEIGTGVPPSTLTMDLSHSKLLGDSTTSRAPRWNAREADDGIKGGERQEQEDRKDRENAHPGWSDASREARSRTFCLGNTHTNQPPRTIEHNIDRTTDGTIFSQRWRFTPAIRCACFTCVGGALHDQPRQHSHPAIEF